jgi:polysaccharide biosynthesis/export protein
MQKTLLTTLVIAAMSVGTAAGQTSTSTPRDPNARGTSGTTVPKPTANSDGSSLVPDYRINAGDKLRVEVYKQEQLSQSLQVRPDGKITLPLLGDIVAVGMTPIELRDRISTSLKEYITNPVVTVIVNEATPQTVFVMGEVNKPGTVTLNGPMTVLQALAMAGGVTEWAKTKDIRVLRKGAGGTQQSIAFAYKDAMKGQGTPIYLQPGDMIVVP